jgi:hypothetical protein
MKLNEFSGMKFVLQAIWAYHHKKNGLTIEYRLVAHFSYAVVPIAIGNPRYFGS